jgi:hypothetical protein
MIGFANQTKLPFKNYARARNMTDEQLIQERNWLRRPWRLRQILFSGSWMRRERNGSVGRNRK